MVGGMAGRTMAGTGTGQQERVSIEIDAKTNKVVNYQHQKSGTGS